MYTKHKFLTFSLFLLILCFPYPSATYQECIPLGFTASFQDVISGAEELIHSVFVSNDVNVEGPLYL